MIESVSIPPGLSLDHYASYAHLALAVQDLRAEAATVAPALEGRKVWMINSTAQGGGVAEMLPRMISLLRELGLEVEWLTFTPHDERFFPLTKKIHNLIHGAGDPTLSEEERALYDEVSERLADELAPRLSSDDVMVVHDPQPAGMGALLERRHPGLVTIWRCHIGLDEETPETRAAWDFLQPYICTYDHSVFSAPEYIPPFLTSKSTVIAPAIDPLTDKNRPLSVHQLAGVLRNAGLVFDDAPVLYPDYAHRAKRLDADGAFHPLSRDTDIGLLYRPIVTQVSRWDRLKGWDALLEGFALMKRHREAIRGLDEVQRRRLDLVRLVLAGPDPASIQDDPEGREVLAELIDRYRNLPAEIREDVALLSLPMASRRENALMVNALQNCSTIVAQNSLREGFGLTATEAMWKRAPVLGSTACGLRQQIRDGLDGRLNPSPTDARCVADLLIEMLGDPQRRDLYARRGQRRVHEEFLVFAQLRRWLRLLSRAHGGTVEPVRRISSLPPEA
ncbi:MAG TPA: glycosyltransferase [Sandaracinaceae bacterium LLY-WYZ-13_1]|nr:glycosyltransferase [Sandaracinaceae bacterium LLY-WYZ-13_1]